MMNRILLTIKTIIFPCFAMLLLCGFNFQQSAVEESMLINSVKSSAFESFFRLCEKKNDTIVIYNNIANRDYNIFFEISCNKKIKFEKSSIIVDVNKSELNRNDKIVFYKIKKVKRNLFELSFINLSQNANLVLIVNDKNEIISHKSGFF